MGTLLWAPEYNPGPNFVIPRSSVEYLVIAWWNVTITDILNGWVFEEHVYGGYRVHATWKGWYHPFGNKSIRMIDLFDDFYAMPPGASTPISAGAWTVQWKVDNRYKIPELLLCSLPGNDANYRWDRLPSAPPTYWGGEKWFPIPPPPD